MSKAKISPQTRQEASSTSVRAALCDCPLSPCRAGASFPIPKEPGRIQLLPEGEFAARDGRPGNMKGVSAKSWRCNAEDAQRLIAGHDARRSAMVIDYEHQSLNSEKNGQPAPAAGWITALEWDHGLFASVEWTERAREYIKNGEYRYISPVFSFDPKTGAVTRLHSAALTNSPALDGMEPARARENINKENPVKKELLAALAAFLALKPEATEDDALAALKEQKKSLADLIKEKDGEIAALKDKEPDPAKYVPVEMLKDAQDKLADLTQQLEDLEKKSEESGLEAEITAALADGRLPKSCEQWARNTAKKQPDTMREFLKTAVPVAALTKMQTEGKKPEEAAALTEDEKYVCQATGVDEKDFLARKSAEGK